MTRNITEYGEKYFRMMKSVYLEEKSSYSSNYTASQYMKVKIDRTENKNR